MIKTYTTISTNWGCMAAVWSDTGLWALSFPQADESRAMADCERQCGETADWSEHITEKIRSFSELLTQQIKIYWQGFAVDFSVPIDWRGYTSFQRAVLQYTATIPYGQTKTYRQTAEAAGSPRAARAAGGALHINRTPIVIPCHRVVGSNGNLTGFGGGLEMKKALLLLESGEYVAQRTDNI